MPKKKHEKRVIAIDPTAQGFGFAVLEGPTTLIAWAFASPKNWRKRDARLDALIERYRPDALVTEALGANPRRGKPGRLLIQAVQRVAARSRISFFGARPPADTNGKRIAKHELIPQLVKSFPELAPRAPRKRRPWDGEAESTAIFDAIAFAWSYFKIPFRPPLEARPPMQADLEASAATS